MLTILPGKQKQINGSGAEQAPVCDTEIRKSGAILVVENDEDLRNSIGEAIQLSRPNAVITAATVYDAAQLFLEHRDEIDLAIVDLNIPLTDDFDPAIYGFELIKYMTTEKPGIQVIIATAYDFLPQAEKAVSTGTATILRKGFDVTELDNAVNAALSSS